MSLANNRSRPSPSSWSRATVSVGQPDRFAMAQGESPPTKAWWRLSKMHSEKSLAAHSLSVRFFNDPRPEEVIHLTRVQTNMNWRTNYTCLIIIIFWKVFVQNSTLHRHRYNSHRRRMKPPEKAKKVIVKKEKTYKEPTAEEKQLFVTICNVVRTPYNSYKILASCWSKHNLKMIIL